MRWPAPSVDAVAGDPGEGHARGRGAVRHRQPEPRLGREGEPLRDARRGAAGRVAGPAPGQVEGAVDQRPAVAAGVAQEHADPAVLDAARRAAVPPLHPGRPAALLEEAGLVQHQHRLRVARVLDHVGAQVVPDRVGVPAHAREQVLHAVRRPVPRRLGRLPAVLALQRRRQPAQVGRGPPPGFRPAGAGRDPRRRGLQRPRPALGRANRRHGQHPSENSHNAQARL